MSDEDLLSGHLEAFDGADVKDETKNTQRVEGKREDLAEEGGLCDEHVEPMDGHAPEGSEPL